jgi:secondary thiamine-phosphate synthase enzyme
MNPRATFDMTQHQEIIEIKTRGQGLVKITESVNSVVSRSKVTSGTCLVFVQHTSASLVIQENADPTVQEDLQQWMSDLAPSQRHWRHDDEGPDDMPAHARAAITKTGEVIPVSSSRLALGTWQGLYLWEHRSAPHVRRLVVHVQGE